MLIYLSANLFELIKNTFVAPNTKQKKKKETLNFEFTDPQKNLVRNILFNTEIGSHPRTSSLCWWCKHNFKSDIDIGCPIKYMREEDTYITEGIFCSISCLKSYVREKICVLESFYKDTPVLLTNYALSMNLDPDALPAPSWKLLKSFRGYMSIDEFRNPSSKQIKETINYRLEKTNTSLMINTIFHNFN